MHVGVQEQFLRKNTPVAVLDSGLACSLMCCHGGSANQETVGVEILQVVTSFIVRGPAIIGTNTVYKF